MENLFSEQAEEWDREAEWAAVVAAVAAEPHAPAADAGRAAWDAYYARCERSHDLAREMRFASGWPSDFL